MLPLLEAEMPEKELLHLFPLEASLYLNEEHFLLFCLKNITKAFFVEKLN